MVGDENPIRQARGWRETVARKLKIPLWTVDADVIVPSKLLEKEQHAAFIIRPRLQKHLKLVPGSVRGSKGARSYGRNRANVKGYTSDIDVDDGRLRAGTSTGRLNPWRSGKGAPAKAMQGERIRAA